jgi:hypothetical protein
MQPASVARGDPQLQAVPGIQMSKDWIERAVSEIARLAGVFTVMNADDLRSSIHLGKPPHPNCIGAAFRLAAKRGLIRKLPYVAASDRPSTHGRALAVWKRSP